MSRMRSRAWTAAVVVVSVALVACGGGGRSASSPAASSGTTLPVDVRTETFVDTSRATAAQPDQAAAPSRTLETAIYVPGGSAPRSAAGRPLILFVHGSGGNPDFYRVLLEGWAAQGYVVAAPRFPSDLENQPGDVSFVLSELLRLSSMATGPYAGGIDGNRIGVAGHSAGGVTVLGVAFNACCLDRRIRAGVVQAVTAEVSFKLDVVEA